MLRMAQIDYIKDMYENEDLSLREISRRTDPDGVVTKSAHLRFRLRRKLRSLPCSSSPHQVRCAGL